MISVKRGKTTQKKTSKRKGNFTKAEKEAYNAGRAYGAAKKGRRISLKTKKERQSFSNGVKSVR